MSEKKGWDNAFTADSPYGTVKGSPSYAGALSFMRRPYSRDLDGVDVAVTGIPLDTTTTHRPGARFGPRAIRAASTGVSWERPWPWDFDPLERLAVVDYGDCEFDPGLPDTIVPFIENWVGRILEAGAATLVLGGDHFSTYPVLRAHAKQFGPLSLVQFDAHSDTWGEDQQRLNHGTMFYHAVNEGLVDDSRSVQVGLRTTNDEPMGFNVLDARFVHRQIQNSHQFCREWKSSKKTRRLQREVTCTQVNSKALTSCGVDNVPSQIEEMKVLKLVGVGCLKQLGQRWHCDRPASEPGDHGMNVDATALHCHHDVVGNDAAETKWQRDCEYCNYECKRKSASGLWQDRRLA